MIKTTCHTVENLLLSSPTTFPTFFFIMLVSDLSVNWLLCSSPLMKSLFRNFSLSSSLITKTWTEPRIFFWTFFVGDACHTRAGLKPSKDWVRTLYRTLTGAAKKDCRQSIFTQKGLLFLYILCLIIFQRWRSSSNAVLRQLIGNGKVRKG